MHEELIKELRDEAEADPLVRTLLRKAATALEQQPTTVLSVREIAGITVPILTRFHTSAMKHAEPSLNATTLLVDEAAYEIVQAILAKLSQVLAQCRGDAK